MSTEWVCIHALRTLAISAYTHMQVLRGLCQDAHTPDKVAMLPICAAMLSACDYWAQESSDPAGVPSYWLLGVTFDVFVATAASVLSWLGTGLEKLRFADLSSPRLCNAQGTACLIA